jgi:hypothetical protein
MVRHYAGGGIFLTMPKYKVTLRDGSSSDRTFESDFQAINETHRPTESVASIVRIDRYEDDGDPCAVWSASPTRQTRRD